MAQIDTQKVSDLPDSLQKKRGRKPGSKSKPKQQIEKKRGRKPAPKKAHTPEPVLVVQVGGREYDCMAVMAKARENYKANHKAGVHTCKVYIKPDENAAYYVINKAEGKIDL